MIITVGGIKGGSGKTTVAVNLAVLYATSGRDVLLVDADDQETASDFVLLRNSRVPDGAGFTTIKLSGAAVRTETLRLAPKYDEVIIDVGGRDTTSQRAAMTVTDVIALPFVPRSFDIWTLETVVALVEDVRAVNPKLVACAFLNRADPRGRDNAEAEAAIAETVELVLLRAPLGSRKAFGNAASKGLAVTELKGTDGKASQEMMALYVEITKQGATA